MRLPALGGAALLAAAIALVPAVSHAEPAPVKPAGADLAPGMRAALQRDLGLTAREVDVRLATVDDVAGQFSYSQALSMLESLLSTWTFSHLLDLLDALGRGEEFEAAAAES